MTKRVLKIIGSVLLVIFVTVFCYFFVGKAKPVENIKLGVTFSKIATEGFNLDWQKTYLEILDDLQVKKIRLIAYWPEIEPEEGIFEWTDLDWQINQAEKRNVEIILAIGQRLPRWPECHIPEWARHKSMDWRNQKLLEYIEKTVNRYKDREVIHYWQIENEPFLDSFGECPKVDKEFLDKEIAFVKSIDSSREIILTESGEFSTWIGAARRSKILGTSLYRIVWSKYLKMHAKYPIPAIFYQRKTALIKKIFDVEKIFIIELQAEPWGPKPTQELSSEEQSKSMDLEKFRDIISYAKRAGFSEAYLWGAEWWYWLGTVHNDNSMWDEAKKLFGSDL